LKFNYNRKVCSLCPFLDIFIFKVNDDEIFAKKGIIKIDLVSFGKDSFYAPENGALFVFERSVKNDDIISLTINASDFRNVKLSKR